MLKSGEKSVDGLGSLDESLAAAGIEVGVAVQADDAAAANNEAEHRARLFEADVGITGSDYAIAETGTVVVHPRGGLSRLVSLAPTRHIAVVRRGTVLPSLDELFLLESEAQANGTLASSMNLITGPSRTGDIEGVIVEGIHGPRCTWCWWGRGPKLHWTGVARRIAPRPWAGLAGPYEAFGF